MKVAIFILLALFATQIYAESCFSHRVNIRKGRSATIQCPGNSVLKGFYRNNKNNLSGITHIRCCRIKTKGAIKRHTENWVASFDKRGWSTCKRSSFLSGIRKSSGINIYNIEYGKCFKSTHTTTKSCYTDKSVWKTFDRRGWSLCKRRGYYMSGMYRNTKNHHGLHMIEEFRCCNVKTKKTKKTKRTNVKCKNVRTRKCRRVRVKPYHKNIRVSKSWKTVRQRYYVKRRKSYRIPRCKKSTYRKRYTKYTRYRGVQKYWGRKAYTKVHYRTQVRWIRKKRVITYYVRRPYTVRVNKRFRIRYKKWHVRRISQKYRTTCRKTVYTRKSYRVAYKTKCNGKVRGIIYKRQRKWVSSVSKRKYFTGRYKKVKKDCYKKVYGIKYKRSKKLVWRRVKTIGWKKGKVPCVRYRTKYRRVRRIVKKSCTKSRIVVKKTWSWAIKHITKKVKQTRFRKYKRTRLHYYRVKKTKRVRYTRTHYRRVRKSRTVWKVKKSYYYRTLPRIVAYYQTIWRTIQVPKYRTVRRLRYKLKRVNAYYYGQKCRSTIKRVCIKINKKTGRKSCLRIPSYLKSIKYASAAKAKSYALRNCKHKNKGVEYSCVYDHSIGLYHTKYAYIRLANLIKRAKKHHKVSCYSVGDPHNQPFMGIYHNVYKGRGWNTVFKKKGVSIRSFLATTKQWKEKAVMKKISMNIGGKKYYFAVSGKLSTKGWAKRGNKWYTEYKKTIAGLTMRVQIFTRKQAINSWMNIYISTKRSNIKKCSGVCCDKSKGIKTGNVKRIKFKSACKRRQLAYKLCKPRKRQSWIKSCVNSNRYR